MHDPIQHRDIVFSALPPGQAARAASLLGELPALGIEADETHHTLHLHYPVSAYQLVALEDLLQDAGFHLDNSLLQKLLRALAYYSEDVQLDNLALPVKPLKDSAVYVRIWEKHQHGDHDETPEELRHCL